MTKSAIVAVTAFLVLPGAAMAQAMPVFNIEQNCRLYGQECIDAEVASRVHLQAGGWAAATPALRQRCIAWETAWHASGQP